MGMMSMDTLEALVRRAFLYASGFAGFAFQGGEPTLAGLDFYREFVRLQEKYNVKKLKISNTIQTNGLLIDDEWGEFLKENNFLVGLSVDGVKETHDALRIDSEGHGTFDRTMKAAEILRKHGVDFNVLCVVNNFVARYPQKVYNELKKFKYIQFIACIDDFGGKKKRFSLSEERYASFLKSVFRLYYEDFAKGNFDNYINIISGHPPESCAMNGFCTCYCVVEGDGSVYPCDFYVLDEYRLGNVNENGFMEMINSAKANSFVDSSVKICDECKKCKYFKLCRGGCRRDRDNSQSGQTGLNRHCNAYKSFFDECLGKMIEMARIAALK